jgi:hypothetical protein
LAARLRDEMLKLVLKGDPDGLKAKCKSIHDDCTSSPPTRTYMMLLTIQAAKAKLEDLNPLRKKEDIHAKMKDLADSHKPIRELIAAHKSSVTALSKAVGLVRNGTKAKKKAQKGDSGSPAVSGAAWFEYAPQYGVKIPVLNFKAEFDYNKPFIVTDMSAVKVAQDGHGCLEFITSFMPLFLKSSATSRSNRITSPVT